MPGNVSVLVGDTDVDGDTLSVATPSDPDHGAVTCNATTCTYTPDPGYLGADSFTYEVSDGLLTDQGLVSVTVRQPNVAPGCANVVPSKTNSGPRNARSSWSRSPANRCERGPAHVRDHGSDAGREDEAGQRPRRPIARRPARFREAASDQASGGARSEGQRACVPDRLHGLRRPGRHVLGRGEGRRAHQAGRDRQANARSTTRSANGFGLPPLGGCGTRRTYPRAGHTMWGEGDSRGFCVDRGGKEELSAVGEDGRASCSEGRTASG